MVTVIAIDYLNQSIGLVAWVCCYGVIFYGPNEPFYINMSVDYQQVRSAAGSPPPLRPLERGMPSRGPAPVPCCSAELAGPVRVHPSNTI